MTSHVLSMSRWGAAALLFCALPMPAQKSFPTAEEAAKALVAATESKGPEKMLELLGPAARDLVITADKSQDEERRQHFAAMAKQSMQVKPDPFRTECFIISVGKEDWPSPMHIIKRKTGYQFDAAEAKTEILARRIGHNELSTIETLTAFVEAEREYAYADLNQNHMKDYAQQIVSTPGKRDGLYWEAKGGAESPLAKIFSPQVADSYKLAPGKPTLYHGYIFRVLKAQGPNAPGGARDFVAHGNMIGGFAFLAYPAEYGKTGIKTFVVNQDGVVREKDLGASTGSTAPLIKTYNPDSTWRVSPQPES